MIVDGHNDLVLRTWRGDPVWHMDLAAAGAAGVGSTGTIDGPSADTAATDEAHSGAATGAVTGGIIPIRSRRRRRRAWRTSCTKRCARYP